MIYDEREKTEAFENAVGSIAKCFRLLSIYREYPKTWIEKAKREGYTQKQINLFYQLQG